jgi:ATP-dependent helicase/nuclease subunit A
MDLFGWAKSVARSAMKSDASGDLRSANPHLAETQRNQAAAADPGASVWVSANAGTGKTHVLTMRVLRLLLAGTPPERILALTYTKAAAAEMSKRVFARLAEWVTAPESELSARLATLLDRPATEEEIERARQLFAIAIETPGGLKVQTIHAFCERLLQRFPLEAGVPPGFAILDDHERTRLLAEAADQTLAEAAAADATPLARALGVAIRYATDLNFDQLLSEVAREQDWLAAAARLCDADDETFAEAEAIYRRAIGIGAGIRREDVEAAFAALLAEDELSRLRSILASGSASDIKASERVAAVLRARAAGDRIDALCAVFITGNGDPRASLMTRGLAAEHPDVLSRLTHVQQRCVALKDQRDRLILLEAAMALLVLGNAVMQRYGDAKARRAALDFDDLVAKTASLLRFSGAVEWVLFKLDGGLDHILVDEAQDTSPVQWEVIRALADEFFSGAGASEAVRTLFAVGDEKQSIYGFQGAEPERFAGTGAYFARRAQDAGLQWRNVPLTLSFRSVAPLLEAVDRVFSSAARTPGVTTSGVPIVHAAHRTGLAGLVEVWETEKHEEAVAAEPWSPLAEKSATPAPVRLATRIAASIRGWLDNGEKLESEDRPIRAGDILILVRKRAPFAAAMISALKSRNIKVAGADRLVLTEQIAVQDLIALGDVFMLPEDDLALACVLKSPLIGLDDDHLLALAPKRKGSLWQELFAQASGNVRFAEAAETLKRWRERALALAPFEFYASLLDGEGMRARMLARLGPEAGDALDEFLNLALAYDEDAPPSLQGFLAWLRDGTRDIKRDMEQTLDEVRVMTVHGAKGLEAPIVFLPDTCSTRSGRRPGSLLRLADAERPSGVPAPILWPVKGTSGLTVVQQAKAEVARAEMYERNRLLYVALTRARDRLYVGGFEGRNAPPPDCWYNIIRQGLAGQLQEVTTADGRRVWQIRSRQTAAAEPSTAKGGAAAGMPPLPDWALRPAPPEPLVRIPLAPSRLAPFDVDIAGAAAGRKSRPAAEPAILPPAALAADNRFLRGTLTHALLQHLPLQPRASWEEKAQAFVTQQAPQLDAAVRKSIVDEALAVLGDPGFAALFGPRSRAEVPIVANVPDPENRGPPLHIAGQIDRLAIEQDCLWIVDYKTNRPPPIDPAQVAEAYLLQLAAYRLAVRRIFSRAQVRAAILWTDGPRIMEIPADLLDAREARLWRLEEAAP